MIFTSLAIMQRAHEESARKSVLIRSAAVQKRRLAAAGKGIITSHCPAWMKVMVIEKVKRLDEQPARQLLNWLQGQENIPTPARPPTGAMAMLGFARKFRTAPRATTDWMNDLRAGERE